MKEPTYKQTFIRLKNILIRPAKEWNCINMENGSINETLPFSFILLTICVLTRFLSVLFSLQEINYEPAMKHAIIVFFYLFGGMYLSYLVMKLIIPHFFAGKFDSKVFKLAAFSATPLYTVNFIVNLIPELFLIYILSLYGFYIAYTGVRELYNAKIKDSIYVAGITIFLILLFSWVIRLVFFKILAV